MGPGVAVVIAASVGVATLVGGDKGPDDVRPGDRQPVAVAASPAERFATVEALVAASDLVVRGTVVDLSRGRVVGSPGGASIESRIVGVAIDDVLAGPTPPGATVMVEEEGFLADGTPIALNGSRPPEVGDVGVWFLQRLDDPELAAYLITGTQGRFVVGPGGAVEGSDPDDPVVAELAGAGLDVIAERVRAAAAGEPG